MGPITSTSSQSFCQNRQTASSSSPELQQTPTHLTHPLKLCILCEMSSNSISLMFELLFMTRCVNYILFILPLCRFFFSIFSPEFFSVVLSLGLRISCALNLPFHVLHLYATIKSFLMEPLVLVLGETGASPCAGWSRNTLTLAREGLGPPHTHTPHTPHPISGISGPQWTWRPGRLG